MRKSTGELRLSRSPRLPKGTEEMSTESSKQLVLDKNIKHIAFIMDGNGRWAKRRGMPREYGHKKGADTFRKIVTYCFEAGLQHVTVYAFSTENWKRSEREIRALMRLFTIFIEDAFEDIRKNDVRIVFIGDRSVFREDMQRRMADLERESAANRNILNVALNYGSRSEIVHAVNTLIERGEKKVSVEMLNDCLYTRLSPDPDLIVRTAGEQRLSNFLLWQAAYSEFYYTDTLWPDMNGEEVDRALLSFGNRQRRFGGIAEGESN